jgi:hypothetical protein
MTALATRLEARLAKLLARAPGQVKRAHLPLVVNVFPKLGARAFAYENMRRLTLYLPPDVARAFHARCIAEGTTMSAALEAWVADYIAKR